MMSTFPFRVSTILAVSFVAALFAVALFAAGRMPDGPVPSTRMACTLPELDTVILRPPTCYGGDGEIEILLFQDTADYFFQWSPAVSSSNLATQLTAGAYEVRIVSKSDPDCFLKVLIQLGELEGPIITSVATQDASCIGPDGQISLEPAQLDYNWSDGGVGPVRTQLAPGVYSVTATDLQTGCTQTLEVVIGQTPDPVVTILSQSDATCLGQDGTAILQPLGLDYQWSDGGAGFLRSDLAPGTYIVTATDPLTQCATLVMVDIGQDSLLLVAAEILRRPDCGEANGQVALTVSQGSGAYSYSWGPGPVRDDLEAGFYLVEVTDILTGCTATVAFWLTDDVPGLTLLADTLVWLNCGGDKNGFLNILFIPEPGFAGPPKIRFFDASGQPAVNGQLGEGFYCVEVRDANDCLVAGHCFEVKAPPALELNALITPADCEPTGTLTLVISGGTPPYSSDWAHLPGPDNPTALDSLAPGAYTVQVRDAQGCLAGATFLVEEDCPPCPPSLDSLEILLPDCDSLARICVDIPLMAYQDYTVLWNGEPYNGPLGGCDLDSVIAYTYFTLLGFGQSGPYFLQSWTVDNQTFSGLFQDVQALVDSMNTWDPAGNWMRIPSQLIIMGGDFSKTYSSMLVQQLAFPNSFAEIGYNVGVVSTTTELWFPEGCHELVIFPPGEPCGDTLKLIITCIPVDVKCQEVLPQTEAVQCVELPEGFDDGAVSYALCEGGQQGSSALGSWTLDTAGCVTYFAGPQVSFFPDTVCIVACNGAGLCDTTLLCFSIVAFPPTPDTIYLETPMKTPVGACVDPSELSGGLLPLELCQAPLHGDVDWTAGDTCFIYTPEPGFVNGQDTFCVVLCDDTGVCDTTIVIVTVTPPLDCPEVIADSLVVLQQADCSSPVIWCAPLAQSFWSQYDVHVDGVLWADTTGCLPGSLVGYDLSLIPDGGAQGPYDLEEWFVNGNPQTGVFQDLAELESLMQALDPAGQWVLDDLNQLISGGAPGSFYGPLRIGQINTGAKAVVETLNLEVFGGLQVVLDTGLHLIVFTDRVTCCTDTVWVDVRCLDCPPAYSGPDTLLLADCNEAVLVCLDLDDDRPGDYSVVVNGASWPAGWEACTGTCVWQYTLEVVASQQPVGPYGVTWFVQGQPVYTIANTLDELAGILQNWDPSGNWTLQSSPLALLGGDCLSDPGFLEIALIGQPGIPLYNLAPVQMGAQEGLALSLGEGSYVIEVTDSLTGCYWSFPLLVRCDSTKNILVDTFIYLGQTGLICLDFGDLGTIISFASTCPDQADGQVGLEYLVGTTCLEVTGLALGVDTFCITICGTLGCCEATVIISVLPLPVVRDTLCVEIPWGCSGTRVLGSEGVPPFTTGFNDCPAQSGTFAAIDLDPVLDEVSYTGLQPGVDTACLVVCDSWGNCDTTIFIVKVLPLTTDTVYYSLPVGSSGNHVMDLSELCLGADTLFNACPDAGLVVDFTLDAGNATLSFTALSEGQAQACLVACNSLGACDTLIVLVETFICPTFYSGNDSLHVEDCQELALICLDIDAERLGDYQVLVNGLPYLGSWTDCPAGQDIWGYQIGGLVAAFPVGPYTVSWQINGQFTGGILPSLSDLADSLNAWNPGGNWSAGADPFLFTGGVAGTVYGPLVFTPALFPIPYGIQPELQPGPPGAALALGAGIYVLQVTDLLTGCSSSLSLEITCGPVKDIVLDTFIYLGQSDTFCLDFGDLGVITGFASTCPESADGDVGIQYLVGTTCLLFTGQALGVDTFCITICGTLGCCQATVIVTVLPLPVQTDTLCVEIPWGCAETRNLSVEVGSPLLSHENSCPQASGTHALISPVAGSSTVSYTGLAVGVDTACLVVCDIWGNCDTTILIVKVLPLEVDTVVISLTVGQSGTYCVDTGELCGNVLDLFEDCPSGAGVVSYELDVDQLCVTYTGLAIGVDTACLVFCDALACDRVILVWQVQASADEPPVAVNDTTSTLQKRPITLSLLENDTLNGPLVASGVVTLPAHGTLAGSVAGGLVYTPFPDFCGGVDSFAYFIQTPFGADTAWVFVTVTCRGPLVIYNGFSPNGDNVNDTFVIEGIEDCPENEVAVFNRWGNQVFFMKGYDNSWGGTWEGNPLPDGTYFYLILDGEGGTYKGYVQIHR